MGALKCAFDDLEAGGSIITDQARAQLCYLSDVPCSPDCYCRTMSKGPSLDRVYKGHAEASFAFLPADSPSHSTPASPQSPPGYSYFDFPIAQVRPAPGYNAPATPGSPCAHHMNPSRMTLSTPFDVDVLERHLYRVGGQRFVWRARECEDEANMYPESSQEPRSET